MKEWQEKLLDRILAALAAALVTWVVSYVEKIKLHRDIKNLEWGVDYYRDQPNTKP